MIPELLNNRYRFIHTLGRGGFGETFLAEDTYLPSGRRCVIKQLKPITNDPQIPQIIQERFAREATILEELGEGHEQIPKLYAYFSETGQYYLVQEWIQGDTLTDWAKKKGTINESSVKEILLNLLPVLAYVHSRGIVHRDVKPDNILIRSLDHQPVLIDFGAVKETMGLVINSQGSTTSSIVIGTPGFMSSEQAIGRPVYSSDLYSLGLVAIYLLTGKKPQQLETDSQTGEIIWHSSPREISPELTAILDKAIMSHPRDRFPTALAMLDALKVQQSDHTLLVSTIPLPLAKEPYSESPTAYSPQEQITLPPSIQPQAQKQNIILRNLIVGVMMGVSIVFGFFLNRCSSIPSEENSSSSLTSPISKPSAAQAVINYYENLNNSQHEKAWNQLSSQLRSNTQLHPDGYTSYTNWWKQVDRIKIFGIDLVEINNQNNQTATVDIHLQYQLKSGENILQSLRFHFIWDITSSKWLINKVNKL